MRIVDFDLPITSLSVDSWSESIDIPLFMSMTGGVKQEEAANGSKCSFVLVSIFLDSIFVACILTRPTYCVK